MLNRRFCARLLGGRQETRGIEKGRPFERPPPGYVVVAVRGNAFIRARSPRHGPGADESAPYRDDFRLDFRVDDFLPVDFRPEDLRPVDFFLLLVRAADLREDDLRDDVFDVRLRGVFSPFSRASFIPIAIACLRLVTLRPPRVLSFPCLRRRIALPTVELAFLLYFLPDDFLLDLRPDVLWAEDFRPDLDALRAAI
jgi:hypothetical protein